jgi:hypothetical protein
MSTKRSKPAQRERKAPVNGSTPESDTPLWHKYYQAMRKRVRFPRYYKHALNW